MVKRISLMALMFVFVAAFAFANEQEANPSSTATENMTIKGTVEKVDPTAQKITIKETGKTETREVSFDQKTSFWGKDKALKASDIKTGDIVAVEVDSADMAVKVSVLPKDMSAETN